MINAAFEHNKADGTVIMRVKGHAGQSEKGNDIICSAASILAYTIAQFLQYIHKCGGLQTKPIIMLSEGEALIEANPIKEYEAEILNAFFVAEIGYSLLAENYPQYVKLKLFGEANKP